MSARAPSAALCLILTPDPKTPDFNRGIMAHKKGVGSSRNGRDSNAQRLGVKRFGGELVNGGTIIVRQRGTKFKPGNNVGIGSDDTPYACLTALIKFEDKGRKGKFVSVYPQEQPAAS